MGLMRSSMSSSSASLILSSAVAMLSFSPCMALMSASSFSCASYVAGASVQRLLDTAHFVRV